VSHISKANSAQAKKADVAMSSTTELATPNGAGRKFDFIIAFFDLVFTSHNGL
jgi:hypothetical protein